MPTENLLAAPALPHLVGISPAGVAWVARHPGDAEAMAFRLGALWGKAATRQADDLIGPMRSLLCAVGAGNASLVGRGAQLRGLRLRGLIVRAPGGPWRITKLGRLTIWSVQMRVR